MQTVGVNIDLNDVTTVASMLTSQGDTITKHVDLSMCEAMGYTMVHDQRQICQSWVAWLPFLIHSLTLR